MTASMIPMLSMRSGRVIAEMNISRKHIERALGIRIGTHERRVAAIDEFMSFPYAAIRTMDAHRTA
jgi:hypothetical protein